MTEKNITFRMEKPIAVLSRNERGYTKEINIVSWNGADPKYDIVCCKQIEELGMVLRQTGGLCICPYGVRHMDRPYIVQIPFRERMIEKMYLYYRKDTQNPMVKRFLETVKQK